MSLSVAGVWQVGVWDQTVWADGVWREGEFVEPAITEPQSTGGWENAYRRYRDEEDVRKQRVALGILPPDEPEREAVIEAAQQAVPILAKRKLRERVQARVDAAELARLEARLAEVIQAQQIAQELAYSELLDELRTVQIQAQNYQRNQNAAAVLLMLSAA